MVHGKAEVESLNKKSRVGTLGLKLEKEYDDFDEDDEEFQEDDLDD